MSGLDKDDRSQADIQLINALLSCPSEEEAEVLNSNQDLVYGGLEQVIRGIAEVLEEGGDRNAAEIFK